MQRILTAVILGAAVLTGCATTQSFSQLTGERWHRSELNTFDVIIISVDDRHYIERRGQPVRIDPGMRTIVVQGPPTGGFRDGEQRSLKLDVQPCTLYHLEARKSNSLAQDFEPRVNHTQPIVGCGVKK
jgi:hypothetical protein